MATLMVKSFSPFPTRCIVINADCADLPTILISASQKSLKSNETSLVASFTAKLTVIIACNHIQAQEVAFNRHRGIDINSLKTPHLAKYYLTPSVPSFTQIT
jgi:hypothetical protein